MIRPCHSQGANGPSNGPKSSLGASVEVGDRVRLINDPGLCATDGQVFPPNSDILNGAASIKAFWQGVFDMGLKEAALETVELDAQGDTAIEVGRYILKADGGAVADQGKYIVIWKHSGGTWKVHRDIWNTNQPAA